MRVKNLVVTFFLIGLAMANVKAQNLSPDSSMYSNGAINAIDYFNKSVTDRAEIYNGAQYDIFPPANKGSFYFQDKTNVASAVIRYNGTWYKNVPALYDVRNDVMVSNNGDNFYVLRTPKITDVYLLNHHFINVNNQTSGNLTPGFYDLLYGGKSTVMVKRSKTIDSHIAGERKVEIFYVDKNDVYVKKGALYYLIDGRGAFLDTFKDKKKEIKQYIKSNKIDFNADIESAVVTLANYYDTLSN